MSKTADARYGLLVKDVTIMASTQGMDFWLTFRDRYEPSGRITAIPGTCTLQGDHAWVRCGDPETGEDSKQGAEDLRQMMLDRGVPKSAVVVRRTPKGIEP